MPEVSADLTAEREKLWKSIAFSLAETPGPMLVWVTTGQGEALRREFARFRKTFPRRKHLVLDVSDRQVDSLTEVLEEKLPETLRSSETAVEQFVHVFGLGNSADPLSDSPLLKSLNSERNLLFRRFRCVLVIWGEPFLRERLRAEAKDFWDWLALDFHFKTAEPPPPATAPPDQPLRGLIVYSEADRDIKNDLEDVLAERAAGRAEWVFQRLETIEDDAPKVWEGFDVDCLFYLVSDRFLSEYYYQTRRSLFGYSFTRDILKTRAEIGENPYVPYVRKLSRLSDEEQLWYRTFKEIKSKTFWQPMLIMLEYCDLSDTDFYQTPVLLKNNPPLLEVDDTRKRQKILEELAESMSLRAESVRQIYERPEWRIEYRGFYEWPLPAIILTLILGALALTSAGFGHFTPLVLAMLVYFQVKWSVFLYQLIQLWNWHPQLSPLKIWLKTFTQPAYIKFAMFGEPNALLAMIERFFVGRGLSPKYTDRYSWAEILLLYNLAVLKALIYASSAMAFFALFKWKDLWWWLVGPAFLFVTFPLAAQLKKIVERRSQP